MSEAATEDQRERELKFDVPDGWQLPELAAAVPAGGSVHRETVRLESTYYDTEGRDLLASKVTLRRRAGDTDTGWQLKVPAGDARTEIRLPPGEHEVPDALRAATYGLRAGADLAPVAVITNDRDLHRLLDADGTPLVEVVVDHVTGTALGSAAVIHTWREVEVELAEGDEALLAAVAKRLTKSGARPASSPSKLARTLDAPARPPRDAGRLSGLVGGYLDQQFEALVRGDVDLRRGRDVIHPTRVATRRYRSVLRVFGSLLDAERAARLDVELAWYAGLLGDVRDRHVLRTHLDAALSELPPELVLGPVADRLHHMLAAEEADALGTLEKAMAGERYLALLAEVRDWHERLPVVHDRPAAAVSKLLHKAQRKVHRRIEHAPRGAGRDEALHRARKAAKRARYTAELARPELGKQAKRATKRMKRTQERLGARQDSVLAVEFLRRAGAAAGAAGENGFTIGILYERERAGLRHD